MANYLTWGKVVEVRAETVLVTLDTRPIEEEHPRPSYEINPGDRVWIYDDGQIEVRGRAVPPVEVVAEHALPMTADTPDPDHS